MSAVSGRPAFSGLLNHAKTATITPSQEATSYDGDNLKIASYSKTWRSTSVGSTVNIDLDLGALKSDIEAIVLHGVNLTDAATWRIRVDNTAGFPSPEHDSGALSAFNLTRTPAAGLNDAPAWGRPCVYLPATTWSGRYVRISLTDIGNGAGYLEAACVSVGPVYQPDVATAWQSGVEWAGGIGYQVARRRHLFGYTMVDAAARRKVLSLGRALYGSGRFTVIPQPGDAASWIAEVVLAKLRQPPEEVYHVGLGKWDLTVSTEEVSD